MSAHEPGRGTGSPEGEGDAVGLTSQHDGDGHSSVQEGESEDDLYRRAFVDLAKLKRRRRILKYLALNERLRCEHFAEALSAEVVDSLSRGDARRGQRLSESARCLERLVAAKRAKGFCRRAHAHCLGHIDHDAKGITAYDIAIRHFEEAGDAVQVAITKSGSLRLLAALGRSQELLQRAQEARMEFQARGDALRLARLEFNLGANLAFQGSWTSALAALEKAYPLLLRTGSSRDLAICLDGMAVCLASLDRPAESEHYRKAARLLDDVPESPGWAVEVEALRRRGLYGMALRELRQLRLKASDHGNTYDLMLSYVLEGQLFLAAGDLPKARRATREALARSRRFGLLGSSAEILHLLARILVAAGQLEAAQKVVHQSESACSADSDIWHDFELLKLQIDVELGRQFSLAELRLRRAQLDKTRPKTRVKGLLALHRVARDMGDRHLVEELSTAALEQASALDDQLLLSHALEERAIALAGRGDDLRALDCLRRAADIVNAHRTQDTSFWSYGLAARERRLREHQLGFLLSALPHEGIPKAAQYNIVKLVESTKATRLLQRMKDVESDTNANSSLEDRVLAICGNLRDSSEELESLADQLEAKSAGNRGFAAEKAAEMRWLSDQIRGRLRFRPTQATEHPFDLLREAMPDNMLLIQFVICAGEVLVLRITPRTFDMRRLGPARGIANELRQLLHGLNCSRGMSERLVLSLLSSLSRRLIGPLDLGDDLDHILVVPDGFLHRLPFHILRHKDRFLVDLATISYAPSATVFARSQARPQRRAKRSLIVFAPDPKNPGLEQEVSRIAHLLPGTVLCFAAKEKREILDSLAGGWDIIHFASHGLFNPNSPESSALCFDDENLLAQDLTEGLTRADLVVMSGCSTGATRSIGADEALGLSHAAFTSGARSLVSTLWDVRDEAGALVMERFYLELVQTKAPADALRSATLHCREIYPDVAAWAPFRFSGAISGLELQ